MGYASISRRMGSGPRVPYDAESLGRDWPIVDTYPKHILANPCEEVTKREFGEHCGTFTVLSDFWKYWAMRLETTGRAEFFKLDFDSEG